MGKRQQRFFSEALTPQVLAPLQGRQVEVVLRTGRTLSGILLAVEASRLLLRDVNANWYNRRKHTHLLPYAAIEEVAYLAHAPY